MQKLNPKLHLCQKCQFWAKNFFCKLNIHLKFNFKGGHWSDIFSSGASNWLKMGFNLGKANSEVDQGNFAMKLPGSLEKLQFWAS